MRDALAQFRMRPIEQRYIIINVAVFLLLRVLDFVTFGFGLKFDATYDLFSAPASLSSLIWKPWTLFTYMFTHKGLWHLIFNMIFLNFVGRMMSDLLGNKMFAKTYWYGGLAGVVLYIVLFNLMPALPTEGAILLGASASVYAIFIAMAVYRPNYMVYLPFIGGVKLKYLAIIFVVLSLPVTNSNTGGHIAHLGGALWGLAFGYNLLKGRDIAPDFSFSSNLSTTKSKKTSTPKSTPPKRSKHDHPNQAEIDRILDKVHKSGYDSLSKKEKETLFKASNQ